MRLTALVAKSRLGQLFFHNPERWPAPLKCALTEACPVIPNFITETEEANLLREIEPHMKRMPYERSHWDNVAKLLAPMKPFKSPAPSAFKAITLYREREMRRWNSENAVTLERVVKHSLGHECLDFSQHSVHVLDLHKDGYIGPHIDAESYCGDVVSGLSLLSDCVMRLRKKLEGEDLVVDIHLPRFSLYKLRFSGPARYDFTHEVLGEVDSRFDSETVLRSRRISIVCREVPVADKKISFSRIPEES